MYKVLYLLAARFSQDPLQTYSSKQYPPGAHKNTKT